MRAWASLQGQGPSAVGRSSHPTTCHVISCISICFDVFICICICVDIYICIYRMRASLQGRGPSKLGRSSHPTTCHVIPLHPHSAHLHICHLPILRVCTTIWSGIRSSYNSNALQFLIGPAMSYPTLALHPHSAHLPSAHLQNLHTTVLSEVELDLPTPPVLSNYKSFSQVTFLHRSL